jgi:hypothetical protein
MSLYLPAPLGSLGHRLSLIPLSFLLATCLILPFSLDLNSLGCLYECQRIKQHLGLFYAYDFTSSCALNHLSMRPDSQHLLAVLRLLALHEYLPRSPLGSPGQAGISGRQEHEFIGHTDSTSIAPPPPIMHTPHS